MMLPRILDAEVMRFKVDELGWLVWLDIQMPGGQFQAYLMDVRPDGTVGYDRPSIWSAEQILKHRHYEG